MTGAEPAVDAFAKTVKLDLAAAGAGRASPPPGGERAADPAAARPGRARERWLLVASVTIAALIAFAIALG
jgi:hypothetical protein